ncbi:MAG: hypothetical protein VX453_04880 [Acidobacteriota bacterium]|nr:hypothetical protein [Acidobacteriota bacterium]
MRILLVIVAVVGIVGAMGMEVAAQEAPTVTWERACPLLPGQAGNVGPALAQEWRDGINNALPGSPAIAFRKHLLPNTEVHIAVTFPDLAAYQAWRESWATDPIVQSVGRRASDSYDMPNCKDELYSLLP